MAIASSESAEAPRRAGQRLPFGILLQREGAPATWALLFLIGCMYALTEFLGGSTNDAVLLRAGANYEPLVAQGEWFRLVSSAFLHIGTIHLLVNGYSLYAVGPFLEKLFGTRKFLAIYVAAALTGSLASIGFNPAGVSAGASGALFGLLGAMLLLGFWPGPTIPLHQKRRLRNIALVTLVINIGIGLSIPHLDTYCHLGGLAGGFAMAALVGPHPLLSGRPMPGFLKRVLELFPLVGALGLVWGLWYVASAQVPALILKGPTNDYSIRFPMAQSPLAAYNNRQALFLSADANRHWVMILSTPNPAGQKLGSAAALDETSLETFSATLDKALAQGDRRLSTGQAVWHGAHRYWRLAISPAGGGPEEAYVTASKDRLIIIRTLGLQKEPWVRQALNQALDTLQFIPSRETPP